MDKKCVTDANKTPLGRPPPNFPKPASNTSLLKPSYLSSDSYDNKPSYEQYQPQQPVTQAPYYSPPQPPQFTHYEYEAYAQQLQPATSSSSAVLSFSTQFETANNNSVVQNKIAPANFSKCGSHSSCSGNSIKRDNDDNTNDSGGEGHSRERKRRRMGTDNETTIILGMPTILPSDIPTQQAEAYLCEDETLHAYVTSNNPESVKKLCDKFKDIIRQGIDMPESQNDLQKNRLREFLLLNGEGEVPKCSNCGATFHRTWNCPYKPNVTNSVICIVCGGTGYISKDCRMKRPGVGGPPTINPNKRAKIDEEYLSLKAELGEGNTGKDEYNSGVARTSFQLSSTPNLLQRSQDPKSIAAPLLSAPGVTPQLQFPPKPFLPHKPFRCQRCGKDYRNPQPRDLHESKCNFRR